MIGVIARGRVVAGGGVWILIISTKLKDAHGAQEKWRVDIKNYKNNYIPKGSNNKFYLNI